MAYVNVQEALSPDLLSEAESFAKQRSMTVEQLLAAAVERFLHPSAPGAAHDDVDLPVAQKLEVKSPEIMGLSYGKMLEILDDDLPIHKLR